MARPTLPRIRRGRTPGISGDVVERLEPRIAELSANGLTWIHVDQPGPLEAALLADRFGFHELDDIPGDPRGPSTPDAGQCRPCHRY
jgi:hypothetical protein